MTTAAFTSLLPQYQGVQGNEEDQRISSCGSSFAYGSSGLVYAAPCAWWIIFRRSLFWHTWPRPHLRQTGRLIVNHAEESVMLKICLFQRAQ